MELDNQNSDNYLMVHILILRLLLLVARNVNENKANPLQSSDLYVKKIVHYLHENYDYNIKVENISDMIHLHPNYIHRIFKEIMSCTIMEYLTKIRIDKAKMLISQTDIPISAVSGFVGINSSQYFSKVFKKYTGISPLEYRKQSWEILKILNH